MDIQDDKQPKATRRGHNLIGKKPAGRTKGSRNKTTLAREQLLSCADVQKRITDGSFVSPLAFLIDIYMDNDQELDVRIDCANKALPYLHKKMPVETNTNITTGNNEQLFQIKLVKAERE